MHTMSQRIELDGTPTEKVQIELGCPKLDCVARGRECGFLRVVGNPLTTLLHVN